MSSELIEGVRKKYIYQVLAENPELFKGAGDIHWRDHVLMQAELQKSVDSSISKTINMPNDATVEDVKEAYELAYTTGCKGVTIYRDGSRDSQVLSTSGASDKGQPLVPRDEQEPTGTNGNPGKADLPDTLRATRYRCRVKDQKVYVIIAEDDNGRPMEVFCKFPYEGGGSWHTLCRSISLALRFAVPLDEVIKQLEKSVVVLNDMPSHLSRILKMYLQSKGELRVNSCLMCGGQVVFEEGCEKCIQCGDSKCG